MFEYIGEKMDQEMADLNGDYIWSSEIDFDYEFDACRFFDFTRPESDADAFEAQRWFDSALSYPPSPFIVKLNLEKDFSVEVEKSSSPKVHGRDKLKSIRDNSNVGNNHGISSSGMNKGLKQQNRTKGTVKAETKSTIKSIKPRSLTLLKPTASHLAKQKKACDLKSSQKGRLPNPSSKMDESELQKSPGPEIEATKRQKLETGYLRKVAQLKHQNSMLHKIVKKVGQLEGSSIYSRSRVTVPREPDLETAHRAQRRCFKSKNIPDSNQHARSNTHGFKARPLNRKILQAPLLPLLKKGVPPVTEFQVFHLKTTERALQHKSANILKVHNRNSALQRVGASKIYPSIEDESLIENMLPIDPPTELFNKLSLRSDTEKNSKSQPKQHRSTKGSKENVPSSFQPEFRKCLGKPNNCGNEMRIPEVRCQPNVNRSVGIR